MKKTLFLAVATAAVFGAAPAMATSVVAGRCVSVSDANGCNFTGNIAPNFVAATQTAYNIYNNTVPSANPDIVLKYIGQSDGGFGTISGSATSGGWSTPGYLVQFLAVKASNEFVLYKLATPASSGFWNTFNITNKRGIAQGLSHLTYFGIADDGGGDGAGGVVPEPATWALLLSGFGMVGFASRRRRAAAVAA